MRDGSEEAVGSWSVQRSAPGLTLLIGLYGVIFLLFAWVSNGSGFGGQVYTGFGDGTMTASEVGRAQASTLGMGLVVLLAVAAVVVFARQRKYRHPAPVLLGIAALQMVALVFALPDPCCVT